MNIKQYLKKMQNINEGLAEIGQPARYFINDYNDTGAVFFESYGFRDWLYEYIVDYYEDLGVTTEEKRKELLSQFMNNELHIFEYQIEVDATLSNGEEYQLLMEVCKD